MQKRPMGCELTIRKGEGVSVHHERKSDGVRVHDEKQRWGDLSI